MYSQTQLARVFAELTSSSPFANPHSSSDAASSSSTAARIARVKRQAMRFFRASSDEYELVFTAGATAALKLVGECFPWSDSGEKSTFAYAMDAHTSVLGIRGYAAAHGATSTCVSLERMAQLEQEASASNVASQVQTESDDERPLSLFAFPAECNFSGVRHSLALVQHVQNGGFDHRQRWFVLLDAAKYVGTHRLDLSVCSPDFVALSFYKMFGYPTGLGALLVRKTALRVLQKRYYGGGTVQSILATQPVVVPRGVPDRSDDSARFADGSPSFLSILSLRHGLDQLETLGMAHIEAHTAALTALLHARLATMRHWNGAPVCELYGQHTDARQGAVVACNFLRPDGSYVGYAEVGKLAAIHAIQLRTGCFCNPGACQAYLRLTDNDLLAGMAAGHVCGDDMDLVDGRPTGAVRLSIGYMTSYEDIAAFTDFASQYFVSTHASSAQLERADDRQQAAASTRLQLRKITLFPVKSCSGMVVDAWPVGSRGLLFDREWAIVDAATNKALSLKELPELCFVHPRVDLTHQTLTLSFRRPSTTNDNDSGDDGKDAAASRDVFVLPLRHTDTRSKDAVDADRDLRVCTDACKGRDVGNDVSQWLSERLRRPCVLVRVAANRLRDSHASALKRQSGRDDSRTVVSATAGSESERPESATQSDRRVASKIGFANQAQYLLLSRASVADLNASLRAAGSAAVNEDAFRANLIVDGCAAFDEDAWTRVQVGGTGGKDDTKPTGDSDDRDGGGVAFDVSGPCSRCSMVNVDPTTGAFSRAPLQALARYRRERSSIFFGQFLTRVSSGRDATAPLVWLSVNDNVLAFSERGAGTG